MRHPTEQAASLLGGSKENRGVPWPRRFDLYGDWLPDDRAGGIVGSAAGDDRHLLTSFNQPQDQITRILGGKRYVAVGALVEKENREGH